MKDFPYLKTFLITHEEQKEGLRIIDNNGNFVSGFDVYRDKIKMDKKYINDEEVYNEFKKVINSFTFDDYPVNFKRVHEIDLNKDSDIKHLIRLLIKGNYFIHNKGKIGPANFLIAKSSVIKKLQKYVKKLNLSYIIEDDTVDYILLGRKVEEKNNPGVFCFWRGDDYQILPVGFNPQYQYIKINIKILS